MNVILNYLSKNWNRLNLARFGSSSTITSTLMTPRFQASGHIIFFILKENVPNPILVAKVPRLPGDNQRLDREVSILNEVHNFRIGGFESIPQVLAYEDWAGNRLLVETALAGQAMRPALVRRQAKTCIEAVLSWLIDFNFATTTCSQDTINWFNHLVEKPLEQVGDVLSSVPEVQQMVEKTRELAANISKENLPLVFEHGDLSSPNILIGPNAHVGIVDWELADPRGLPALDLFFFLTYIAFAQKKAKRNKDYVAAFHQAFFGQNAWALPHISIYAKSLHLNSELLEPLFLICWCRYVANLVNRLKVLSPIPDGLEDSAIAWLRSNRYFVLWKHSIEHLNKLNLR
jgi:aminoglycoside phosphotransferase